MSTQTDGAKSEEATMTRFAVEHGATLSAPVWESHKRGKNWMAVIAPDPRAPSGLARTFIERAKGPYYYVVDGVAAFTPVEFGADYYTGAGGKRPERVYGVVHSVTDTALLFEQCKGPHTAIKRATKLREDAAQAHALTMQLGTESLPVKRARVFYRVECNECGATYDLHMPKPPTCCGACGAPAEMESAPVRRGEPTNGDL